MGHNDFFINLTLCGKANRGLKPNCRRLFPGSSQCGFLLFSPVSTAAISQHFALVCLLSFHGVIDMKKAFRNMAGLNTTDFDNWLEPTTIKIPKHAKSNKSKFW